MSMYVNDPETALSSGLMVQAMKPKAEVYALDERYTKTRNIYALSAPVTVLLNAVQHPIFKGRPAF